MASTDPVQRCGGCGGQGEFLEEWDGISEYPPLCPCCRAEAFLFRSQGCACHGTITEQEYNQVTLSASDMLVAGIPF